MPFNLSSYKYYNLSLSTYNVEGDRGAGEVREAGSLRWPEAGEKFKKTVKEMNPTTFLDFHFTFSEA